VPSTFTFYYSLTFNDINDPVNGPFSFGAGSVEVLAVNASFMVDVEVDSFAELELVTSDCWEHSKLPDLSPLRLNFCRSQNATSRSFASFYNQRRRPVVGIR
jgi:hypothetical protein